MNEAVQWLERDYDKHMKLETCPSYGGMTRFWVMGRSSGKLFSLKEDVGDVCVIGQLPIDDRPHP